MVDKTETVGKAEHIGSLFSNFWKYQKIHIITGKRYESGSVKQVNLDDEWGSSLNEDVIMNDEMSLKIILL